MNDFIYAVGFSVKLAQLVDVHLLQSCVLDEFNQVFHVSVVNLLQLLGFLQYLLVFLDQIAFDGLADDWLLLLVLLGCT